MKWRRQDKHARQDEVLGIRDAKAGEPGDKVPSGGGSIVLSDTPETKSATGALGESKGATGIDMGAGGTGTDIEP